MSSNSSNTDESDGEAYVDDFYETESSYLHPLIERDIQLFKQYYPTDIIDRVLDNLDEIDIEMTVDLGFIERNVLDAWGLCLQQPLTLKLNMNKMNYSYDKNLFRIEVFQGLIKQTTVMMQLKNIALAFIKEYFTKHGQREKEVANTGNDGEGDCEDKSSIETKGLLVQLHTRIMERLPSLNDYCPICDRLHGATSMLKPTICSSPLCIFSFQTMGVMCQVTDVLQTQPEVAKLLIAFTHFAATSSRQKLVLQPFPDLMESSSQLFVFRQDDDAGNRLLREVVKLLYDYNFMFSGVPSESELRELLHSRHKYCYPLMRWIISSNRSHILHIPIEKQMTLMGTKQQFILRNSPPAEEVHFRALAKTHGSCFAFHGSPLDNWHSIIRKGLLVASGTEHQLNGAALGKGIYLTPNMGCALDYALRGIAKYSAMMTVKKQLRGSNSKFEMETPEDPVAIMSRLCVALCEVITGPKLKKKDKMRWVVEDSQHICTRFFFVYPNTMKLFHVESTSSEFQDCVNSVLSCM